jgi:hypothetical protein
MIVLAYLLAANMPGPWSDWMGPIGVIAVVDAAVMLAEPVARLERGRRGPRRAQQPPDNYSH